MRDSLPAMNRAHGWLIFLSGIGPNGLGCPFGSVGITVSQISQRVAVGVDATNLFFHSISSHGKGAVSSAGVGAASALHGGVGLNRWLKQWWFAHVTSDLLARWSWRGGAT